MIVGDPYMKNDRGQVRAVGLSFELSFVVNFAVNSAVIP
jgi:hypothetical protein